MAREHSPYSGAPFRLSWPAVFGGIFAATGVWLLLYALGLALGFSQFDLNQQNLARAVGIGTSIWVIVSAFLAMFVGGLVTARSAGYLGRGNGALHGIVLWGATSFVVTMSVASMVSAMATQVAQTGTEMASGMLSQAGLNTDQLLTPVNEALAREGKPQLTADQLRAVAEDAATTAVTQGRLDEDTFVASISRNTQLTEQDVRQIFGSASQQMQQRFDRIRAQASQAAEGLARATGRMFWGLFALLITSLVGSVLGASTGVSRRQRELVVAATPVVTGTRPSEVYP